LTANGRASYIAPLSQEDRLDRNTRRGIKHDKFVDEMGAAYAIANRNRARVAMGAIAVLAMALIAWGIVIWRGRQAATAQAKLAEAITVMDAPTGSAPQPGVEAPQFKTEQEKYAKAEPMFAAIVDDYSGSDAADVADLYLAHIATGKGDVNGARTRFEKFVREHPDHILAGGAQMSLYELRLQGGSAKDVVTELEQALSKDDTILPKDAILAVLARAYEVTGAPAKARDIYQRIVNEFPESPYTMDAQRKLATV
jgi:TolA-binding protein